MQEEQKALLQNQESLLKEESELQEELQMHKDSHFRDVLDYPTDARSPKPTKCGQSKVTTGSGRVTVPGPTAEQDKGHPRRVRESQSGGLAPTTTSTPSTPTPRLLRMW